VEDLAERFSHVLQCVVTMPPASNLGVDESGINGAVGICAALFEVATPALFVRNAFRVAGLAVDASPREITQQVSALKLRHRLGAAADPKPDALSGEMPATLKQLRDAEHRLRCPEHRLIDEIFWFWPIAESGSKSDAALHAVAAGDYATAEKIWKNFVSHPKQGIVAVHNLAVRWQLTALRLENRWKAIESDDKARETLFKCWRYALTRWDRLLGDYRLWAHIEQRIRALFDPRVSPNLARQLRAALPSALASINAALTLAHAEADEPSLVAMHVRLIRDGQLILPAGQYSKMVVERATKYLRQRLRTPMRCQEAEPHRDLDEARQLVHKLATYDRLFAMLGCAEARAVLDLIDEGLQVCVVSAVASNKLTDDNVGFLDLLKNALRLAKGSRMRTLVQRNLDVGRQVVLVPLNRALAAVNGRAESPARRYARFGHDVLPVLTAIVADLPLSEECRSAAADAAARVLRTISIDAWTKARDADTASAALNGARKYAIGDSLQSQLYEDFSILTEILSEQGAPERKRPFSGAAWCAGALTLCTLAVILTVHLSKSVPQNSGTASSTVAPSIRAIPDTPEPPAAYSNSNAAVATGQIYRVPNYAAAEPDGDQRVTVEQKQAAQQLEAQYRDALSVFHEQELEANDLEQQLREQSTQIDSERLLVDNSDPSSLEDVHSKIDYYNSLVSRARTAQAATNALVEPLNALGQRVNGQNAYVNRPIDDYNARARRVDK
jgi:hypothetical protein